MTHDETRQFWKQAQENVDALAHCTGPHDFVDVTPEKKLGKHYRCSLCDGEVEQLHHMWYRRGVEHGVRAMLRVQV